MNIQLNTTVADVRRKVTAKAKNMKTKTRIICALALVIMLCATLTSCSKKLSGQYSADIYGTGIAITFEDENATIAITVAGFTVATLDATYEIKDDTITFDIADEDSVTNTSAKKVILALEAPSAFEEGEGYIMIGDTKYVKLSK